RPQLLSGAAGSSAAPGNAPHPSRRRKPPTPRIIRGIRVPPRDPRKDLSHVYYTEKLKLSASISSPPKHRKKKTPPPSIRRRIRENRLVAWNGGKSTGESLQRRLRPEERSLIEVLLCFAPTFAGERHEKAALLSRRHRDRSAHPPAERRRRPLP